MFDKPMSVTVPTDLVVFSGQAVASFLWTLIFGKDE